MSDAQEGDVATSIKDVARAAGVSTATVSRSLRGLANVDPAPRARVARVAAAGDVGTGHDAEHGRIVAHGPRAKAFAEVGVQIDLQAHDVCLG